MPPTPIKSTIQSDVVDIRGDTPRSTDLVLVDTNVWIWTAYARGPKAAKSGNDVTTYQRYLGRLRTAKAQVFHAALSLGEMAHVIEKIELEIFNDVNKVNASFKTFRHNYPTERAGVVAAIKAAWATVESMSVCLPITIDKPTCGTVLDRLGAQQQNIDAWDGFMLESAAKQGITHVLTHDGDFANLPGLVILTANGSVLNQAGIQGKKKVR